MRMRHLVLSMLVMAVLTGCSAMLVPASDDPATKLKQATSLFDRQDRPLPAERLIREAIDIYNKENNQLGLADAYRTYGFFFRSASIEKWHKHYKESGFLEKSATFDTRYDKSIEYFEKAKNIFTSYKKFDDLVNVDLNMGFTYEFAGNKAGACKAYEASISSSREYSRLNPNSKLIVPKGYSSYEDYANTHRKRLKCI